MNLFAIFYQSAFLYISYALADANREKIHRFKEARINSTEEGVSPQVFNTGEVYLYRITREAAGRLQYYVIGDGSDKDCSEFPIALHNTIVTNDSITVKWFERTITLKRNETECSNFSFYKTLFTLEGFDTGLPIVKAALGSELLQLKNGFVQPKRIENVEVVFAIADKNVPHVMFPKSCVTVLPKMEASKEVSVELNTEPKEVIKMLFTNSDNANVFHKYISRPPSDMPPVRKNEGEDPGLFFIFP